MIDFSTEHKTMKFSDVELNTFREWFNAVQDLNPEYLEKFDYFLAERIYRELGLRVSLSIKRGKDDPSN